MKAFVALTGLFSLLQLSHAADVAAPKFSVNLDAPPSERWTESVTYMISTYGFDHSYQNVLDYVYSYLPPPVVQKLEPLLLDLLREFPGEAGEEIKGIHQTITDLGYGDQISLGELTAINLMYEFTVFCTSIVAENSAGELFHGRNLDYSISGLQNLTAQIDFTRAGETVYKGTEFVGYVGLLTGMRPGGWSVSVDQRATYDFANATKKESLSGLVENLVSAATGGSTLGMFLRNTLETETSFADAVDKLKKEKLIAPVYLTVAGTDHLEGAVITRNRLRPDQSHREGVWSLTEDDHFRLVTNYDHWDDVPEDDNRRDPANDCMNQYDFESLSLTGSIYDCLSTAPVLNKGTVYTTLMNPKQDIFETTIRNQNE
ncbi:hypothetical protein TrVE_jg3639 [Triparma verrucosa]|uniref:N-acylethanolamine-hydrolyzing acid amidase n=1 Tax=Triparma verrucosa TaxID=1606542 RepID=A0A9W7EW54_9STRA|nr:hypothetical protein TrVE_jg3639 [Triparma verrucosa]